MRSIKVLKAHNSTAVRTLAGNIETAHQNGSLFFLAAQLRPMLEKWHEDRGEIVAAELEMWIVEAAAAMVRPDPDTPMFPKPPSKPKPSVTLNGRQLKYIWDDSVQDWVQLYKPRTWWQKLLGIGPEPVVE